MRYVLAAILVCAVGAPAASALPAGGPKSVSLTLADPIVQVAKRAKVAAAKPKKKDSGIHPLVGSGDY